jgi:hypothetical protein
VLERTTPHNPPESDDPDFSPTGETAASPDVEPAKGRGGRKSQPPASRAAKKITGHTIYMPDDLFERIMVQAHRRKRTISEYVAAILERQVPDHRTVVREPVEG